MMRAMLLSLLLGASIAVSAGAFAATPGYTIKPLSQLAIYPQSRALAQVVAKTRVASLPKSARASRKSRPGWASRCAKARFW